MAAARPTWRNLMRGMAAEATADAPTSSLELKGPAMAKTEPLAGAAPRQSRLELGKRALKSDLADQLSLLEPLKASIARLAVDHQAHMTCADNLEFMRSLGTGTMK